MHDQPILVLNCGSSSIKFALFEASQLAVSRQAAWSGQVHGITGSSPTLQVRGGPPEALQAGTARPYHVALARIRERVEQQLAGRQLRAVAHRVVHGGGRYAAPTLIDPRVLADLRAYMPLAPLHQPFALEAIGILLDQPGLPQIACFDTAFHHSLPLVEQLLPLPQAIRERGLRRYGFHGLSYEYLATVLPERHGQLASGRVICAHLGSGASLCAMRGLRSVATTMGFSALDGLMMGTRCGALDPGAVLHLMQIEKLDLQQVSHLLYHESGLLGVSGISADPRVLLQQEQQHDEAAERARIALQLYVRRLVHEIGAMVAVLGGLDLLVFTAGIGENNAQIRHRVCQGFSWLGIALDDTANAAHLPVVSSPASRVTVAVEPTNEEWTAARDAVTLLAS